MLDLVLLQQEHQLSIGSTMCNKKTCTSCGAVSTPQWREGPCGEDQACKESVRHMLFTWSAASLGSVCRSKDAVQCMWREAPAACTGSSAARVALSCS